MCAFYLNRQQGQASNSNSSPGLRFLFKSVNAFTSVRCTEIGSMWGSKFPCSTPETGIETLSCSWRDPLNSFLTTISNIASITYVFRWLCNCEILMIMLCAVTSFQGCIFKSGPSKCTVVCRSMRLPGVRDGPY